MFAPSHFEATVKLLQFAFVAATAIKSWNYAESRIRHSQKAVVAVSANQPMESSYDRPVGSYSHGAKPAYML